MSFNINRPNSFKLSSLPKLHQPNLFALYRFDTKNLYKIQTKYTYSKDKQSPFTPDSITNISPHSIIVSPHLLITRHQTGAHPISLKPRPPPFSSLRLVLSNVRSNDEGTLSILFHARPALPLSTWNPTFSWRRSFAACVCLDDRGQTSPIEVFRPFASRFERRPVGQSGSVSHYATVATVAASQQWPELVRDDTWNRRNVRPMRPSGKWGKPPASWSHAGVKVSVHVVYLYISVLLFLLSFFFCSFFLSFLRSIF